MADKDSERQEYLPPLHSRKVEQYVRDTTKALTCFSLRSLSHMLGFTAPALRRMIKDRRLKGFYLGRHLRVPAYALKDFYDVCMADYDVTHFAQSRQAGRFDPARLRHARQVQASKHAAEREMRERLSEVNHDQNKPLGGTMESLESGQSSTVNG